MSKLAVYFAFQRQKKLEVMSRLSRKKMEVTMKTSMKKVEAKVQSSRKKVVDTKRCLRESVVSASHTAKSYPQKKIIMNMPSRLSFFALIVVFAGGAQAQSSRAIDSMTRPRSVAAAKTGSTSKSKFQGQSGQSQTPARPQETGVQSSEKAPANINRQQSEESKPPREETGASLRRLSLNRIRARVNEAQRLMKVRPLPTAMAVPSIEYVTLAALLPETSEIHLIRILKPTFLNKGATISSTSSLGLPVEVRVLRANGVNTAVTVFDQKNRSLLPLVVEFPIERRGVFHEMAYYTSAHPALLSADVTKAGQTYVSSMVDLAAKRLRDKGITIPQNILEVAKRLCIVEHTDHDRFRNENRIALFEEIYSLYALNLLETYRYSVSSAGAGGMVQMIPWTYALMKQRHPGVGLNPDFVAGMRNHGNALEAMLLYMQDTWSDLLANEDVQSALSAKQATPAELMAAGYNSNAAKLPGYIRRGGSGWRTLIPRETQVYLQIYQSFDSLMKAKENHARRKKS
jgi:hypothetical protein